MNAHDVPPARSSRPVSWVVGAIRFYQRRLSPLKPPVCRFTPTCSEYMAQAVTRYGIARGVWLGIRRLLRCAPWNPGGYDPLSGTVTGTGTEANTAVAVNPAAKAADLSRLEHVSDREKS